MVDIRENICNCIDTNLKAKKLTNEGLASFVGKNESTVRGWRTHKIAPSIDLLPGIAEYLGVTLNELLGLTPDSLCEEEYIILKKYLNDDKFKAIVNKITTDDKIKEALYLIVDSTK